MATESGVGEAQAAGQAEAAERERQLAELKAARQSGLLVQGRQSANGAASEAAVALSGQGDLVQAIRMSTQDSVARAGDQITQRNLGVQPTITIRPSAPVRLVVHRDLILAPWRDEGR